MKRQSIRTGLAGLLVAAAVVPVARAADVTVRAESFAGTTLPQTTVDNMGPNALANGKSCPTAGNTGRSAAGALERATNGSWNGSSFSFGLTVERILQTNLGPFGAPTYWNFDVDNVSQQVGICDVNPDAGDEILFYEACASQSATACYTGRPLGLTGPATVTAGQPFQVSVVEFDDTKDPAPSTPSANATIAGGGQSATTAAAGRATFQFDQPGPVTLVATKGRQVRDSLTVSVQAAPVYAVPTAAPSATATATPDATSPADDVTAPVTTIKAPTGRFAKGKGPRRLRVAVADAGGVDSVRFALTRKSGKSCSTFDAASERFQGARCGARRLFSVDAGTTVSFLLPARLRAGKYTFVALATDAAGNAEGVERGRNRVVFRVK